MRRTSTGWIAACEGRDYEHAAIEDAIRDAVGHERGETLQLGAATHESIGSWVTEQARRIEQEAAGLG